VNRTTVVFLAAVVGGTACALVGTRLAWPWLTVAGPTLAVALYALCASLATRWGISREQFGDSAYFLGFLFTLIGLTLTLASLPADLERAATPQLTNQFALALATTIVGLVARMLISGFTPRQEEAIDLAEKALADASLRLSEALDGFAARTHTQVNATEVFLRRILASTQGALEAQTRAFEAMPERLDATLNAVATRTEAGAERALEPLASAASRLSHAIDTATRAVEAVPSELVSARLASLLASAEAQLGRLNDVTARTAAAAEQVPRASAQVNAALDEIRLGLENLRGVLRELGTIAEGSGAALSRQSQLLHQAVTQGAEDARRLAELREQVAKDLALSQQALVMAVKEFREAAEFVRRGMA